jgi:hypothetical protein
MCFAFGKTWRSFAAIADEETSSEAQRCSDDRLGTGSSQMTLTMRPTGLGHGVYKDSVDYSAPQSRSIGRALPYVLSWMALGALMVIGSERVPSALYRPVDGDWAKWNVEAILHFGKPFDLGAYSMQAGMGSMYFPNLPWLIRVRWRSAFPSTVRPRVLCPTASTRPSWLSASSRWRA